MAEVKTDQLTDAEAAIFDDEWDKVWTKHSRARELMDVYMDHHDSIKLACSIMKFQLELPFGGQMAKTNEFGWMPIMPNHLLAQSSAATYATATWQQQLVTSDVTTRYKDFIGTSTTDFQISRYAGLIIIGFIDAQGLADPYWMPKIDAVLPKIKGVQYPVIPCYDQMLDTDYPIFELATPWIIEPLQTLYIQELVGRAGQSQFHPIGVYFARGDNMRQKTAYAQQ
jgi:hypothetical protein